MRGLTASGDGGERGGDRGRGRGGACDSTGGRGHGGEGDGGGHAAAVQRGRRLTGRAASATTLVGLAALGLFSVSCSTGGTGTRDEGPAGTQPVAQVTPSDDPSASARPAPRVDPVALLKRDPKVSERVRTDLKPCAGSDYPVDTSYGTLTGGPAADVVVNVMTCADSVGVGTYVYRREGNDAYRNVFAIEQPAVYGTIDRGDLVVTTQVYEKKDSVAYPSGEEVITYRWSGSRFGEHDRVHNDFNRAVGSGGAALPGTDAEPAEN
ncbi:hypothetical protein ACFVWY_23065 [Streptomyces sp. NPDC058195]|uniref:hypothetical protein n=1 Tax=Streptomyces sp. NPDC058195 TaxID=3346375 RepID=UPI0036EC0CFE